MTYIDILFYFFAALTVGSALIVVFSRNVVYAAFSLMFTFLGVAGLYVLLQADFVAIAQVLVYVGGILVLLIFGVMLTSKITNVDITSRNVGTLPATIIVGVFLGTMVLLVKRTEWITVPNAQHVNGTAVDIGEMLMTTFLLPFEVTGVLLLIAIMGAAMIARHDDSRRETA